MVDLIVLTGVSKGLGNALLKKLCKVTNDHFLIGISRNRPDIYCEKFKYHNFNLQNLNDLERLEGILDKDYPNIRNITFINNAGVISPVGKIKTLDKEELIQNIKVNFLSSVIIISSLIRLAKKLRVVNITSGAANRPIAGWSAYCSAKAGAKMFFEAMHVGDEIELLSIDPGVMDTGMQEDIRKLSIEEFSDIQTFISFKEKALLKEPRIVAEDIVCEMKLKGFI